MPQGQGYGNQKRQTFNYTSGFQNALSAGTTAATIHPYLALPAAAAGFYFGGKSGPFEPSSMDYKPFRDAYQNYENSALKNLRQGVNAIGSQSSQRAASQGLYGSPLGQSIIQNNQNYALNSGLGNINNNRYQFEAGLAQNQFNAQQAYDQQMGQQSIGTLTNLLASTPGIIESVKGLQNRTPSIDQLRENAYNAGGLPRPGTNVQGAPQASTAGGSAGVTNAYANIRNEINREPGTGTPNFNVPQNQQQRNFFGTPQQNAFTQQPTPSVLQPSSSLQAYDQQMRKRSIGTGTSEFPDQLSQQPSTPQAPQPPKTELEQYGRIVSSELVDEINSMFGDIFDFDSPLAPLGSAIDSAIANQGQVPTQTELNPNYSVEPTPESTIRQGTIPGGDPNPNAPPAAPPQNWFPGQRPITTATSNADIRSRTIPGGDVDPNTPLPNPNIPYDPIQGVPQNLGEWKDYIDRKYGITPRQQADKTEAIDIARELIIFGETDASRRYARQPIADPASGGGYNIGWGRNITHNGLDVQNELIPMLRGSVADPARVTDNYLQSKLSVAGISMTQEGKVRLTPRQVNKLFPNGIDKQMADTLRENDIKAFIPEIKEVMSLEVNETVYDRLTPTRQAVLIDMFYTLGKSRFGKFRVMILELQRALKTGNYSHVASEMRNSGWYSQVGKRRADPLIAKMIAGE